MNQIFENIKDSVLKFINGYPFQTELDECWATNVDYIYIYYKSDYFREDGEYYKKGIGNIIVHFSSGYQVVIKHTVDDIWCFAVLDSPYDIREEVWILSDTQKSILPEMTKCLEQGFSYRNKYSNLFLIFNQQA